MGGADDELEGQILYPVTLKGKKKIKKMKKKSEKKAQMRERRWKEAQDAELPSPLLAYAWILHFGVLALALALALDLVWEK